LRALVDAVAQLHQLAGGMVGSPRGRHWFRHQIAAEHTIDDAKSGRPVKPEIP